MSSPQFPRPAGQDCAQAASGQPPPTILHISSSRDDQGCVDGIFAEAGWKLLRARTYREALHLLCTQRMPVILCERRLPDGDWRDVLGQVAPLNEPPRLIVTADHADDGLWAEVLNLGGYDVLLKPLDRYEVLRVVRLACEEWQRCLHTHVHAAMTA